MNRSKLHTIFAIAVAVVVTFSAAATTGTEAIKQRQQAMEGVRDGIMTLGAIAKKEQPFDAEVVHASAAKIANNLEHAAELFPEGSAEGEVQTWAKPEIWTDRAWVPRTSLLHHGYLLRSGRPAVWIPGRQNGRG
jgi:cytochrome c556